MVEILDETRHYPHLEALEQTLEKLMLEQKLQNRSVTVVLCDDTTIQNLNREHRGIDKATDVLSYPLHEPDDLDMPQVPHLGDIIISTDTAARQANERGQPLSLEVGILAAHGLMHLLGYDHDTEEARQVFEKAQKRMQELIKIAEN